MSIEIKQIPLNNNSHGKRIYRQRYLLFMALPAVIWMIVFNYIPMYGIIIAFKRYRIFKSISASP